MNKLKGCLRSLDMALFSRPYITLLVVGSDNVLHHCRDMTAITVYVTVCDLEKSFSFNTTVKAVGHLCIPIWA